MEVIVLDDIPSLDDIPFDVFVNFILPRISVKEVGSLTMMSSTWRAMCDEQDVWRTLYMRGLTFKVTDASVHIGPKILWTRDPTPHNWRASVHRTALCKFSQHWTTSYQIVGWCLPCCPNTVKSSLAPWSRVRQDGINTNLFTRSLDTQLIPRCTFTEELDIYLDYVEEKWTQHNRDRGLSVVNLCQCAEHYRFDTLLGPTKCRASTSFKTLVLKKRLTQEKNASKKKKRAADKCVAEYEKFMAHAYKLEQKMKAAQAEEMMVFDLCDKLDMATKKK